MKDNKKIINKEYKDENIQKQAESIPEEIMPKEIGGSKGPEPTRYGDWEKKGRCIDF
jgi:hypothetical protein